MRDPKLTLTSTITGARTYRFVSTERLGGWARCTVNDQTGELLITSDWGNWSHSWYTGHLGRPSLTHFIADGSYDYLACKLLGRADARTLDDDATIASWRRRLAECRLEYEREVRAGRGARYGRGALTAERAREIWDELGELAGVGNEAVFADRAYNISGFSRWISEEPWEDLMHKPSAAYEVLTSYVLPALAEACRSWVRWVDAA